MSDLTPTIDDVPAEVLEAAAKAIHASDDPSGKLPTWEEDGEGDRDVYRVNARAAYPAIAAWVTAQALQKAADELDALADRMDRQVPWDERVPGVQVAADAIRDRANQIGGDHE